MTSYQLIQRRHKVKTGPGADVQYSIKVFNKFKSHAKILGFKVINPGSADG